MLLVGWLVTAFWLVGLIFVVLLNSDSALGLKLNEWGDFLSGGFAPLAFFWLVLGYFQQGKELKLSREALLLQASELRLSVLQQEQLVSATREDIDLSKGEIRRRLLAERKKVEPLFVLKSNMITNVSDDEVYCWLKFSNYGGNVRSVFISAITMPKLIHVEMSQEASGWDNWKYEVDKEVMLVLSRLVLMSLEVLAVSISYIDSNGEKGRAQITFSLEEGNIMSINCINSSMDASLS